MPPEQATMILLPLESPITLIQLNIYPEEQPPNSTGRITLTPRILIPYSSIEKEMNPFRNFPDHPIPSDLMGLILFGGLLGPPLYHLYKVKRLKEDNELSQLSGTIK